LFSGDKTINRLVSVRISVIGSSEVDRSLNPGSALVRIVVLIPDRINPKTNHGLFCFFAKHTKLLRKTHVDRENVLQWSDKSPCGLCCQCASDI